jgi:pimeloyl-ACP methyl ester carboxylesterase
MPDPTAPRIKMQTDAKGHGPPMVLVGGGLTGWASWEPHQARLSATRMVVRAQPLAVQFGLDNAKLPANYSIRLESEALRAALDDRELTGPIDLVAWSYGAVIALDFALEHPARIRTLTLIEPPAFWVLAETGTLDAQAEREAIDLRADYAGMTEDVTEAQLARFVRAAGLVPPDRMPESLPQWPAWVRHRRSLRTGDAVWQHHDSATRLRAFGKPVLLFKGTGSSHFLFQIIDGLGATLPHAQVVELAGGHAPQLVAMDAFLDRLDRFVAASR